VGRVLHAAHFFQKDPTHEQIALIQQLGHYFHSGKVEDSVADYGFGKTLEAVPVRLNDRLWLGYGV